MIIQSHSGPYSVSFIPDLAPLEAEGKDANNFFIVDARVAEMYSRELGSILGGARTIVVEAKESNKEIANVVAIMEQLVSARIRRSHTLVAIGGGIIQDIACFIGSVLYRGVKWKFYPTTLLAQADSCIGSKSSINLGSAKNIIGTFNPPVGVVVCRKFLVTLDERDVRSGIGEIIKVHAIDGAASFDRLSADYDGMLGNSEMLSRYIEASLRIKQRYIEEDEFDQGIRNIFNYGHTFGHAIESATDFEIPHGIAISIGMSIANKVAALRGLTPARNYERMQPLLRKNYAAYAGRRLDPSAVIAAMSKDKKNTVERFVLILPVGDKAAIERVEVPLDHALRSQIAEGISAAAA